MEQQTIKKIYLYFSFLFFGITFICLPYSGFCDDQIHLKSSWNYSLKGFALASPMIGDISGDGVYDIVVGDHDGRLTVINGQTGKLLQEWSFKGSINASPIIADFGNHNLNDILVCTDKGEISLFDPHQKKILCTWFAKGGIQNTPALGNILSNDSQQLIVTDDADNVYCLNVSESTISEIWSMPIGFPATTSPVLADLEQNKSLDVVVGCENGKIILLDGRTGEKLNAKYSAERRVSGTPAIGDINKSGIPAIIVGSEDHYIYAFSKGDILWNPYKTNGEIKFSPALTLNTTHGEIQIVCLSNDNSCNFLDGPTGKLIGTFPLDSTPSTAPVVVDMHKDGNEETIVGTESGEVSILDNTISPDNQIQKMLGSIKVDGTILSLLVGDIGNHGTIDLVIHTQKKIYVYNTSIPIDSNTLLWPTLYGNLHRTGQVDTKYLSSITQKMDEHQYEVDSVYKLALVYKQNKEWDKALITFQSVLRLNSNHPEAAKQIGEIYFSRHYSVIIKTILIIFLVLFVSIGLWYTQRVRGKRMHEVLELLTSNQIEPALKKYGKLIHHKESNLLPELAMAYARTEQSDDAAIKVYEQVLSMNPFTTTPTKVHYILAKSYSKENRTDDQSRLVYEMALQFKQDDWEILRAHGRASRTKQDVPAMIRQYERLYQLGEKDSEVIVNLARGYLVSKKTDEFSLQIYQQAYKLDSDDNELISHMADCYISQNKFDEQAFIVYEKACTLNPDNSTYPLAVAQCLIHKLDFKTALDVSRPILQQKPSDGFCLMIVGRAHLGLREFGQAVEYLEKALLSFPTEKSLVYDLARAYAGFQNSGDRALEIFKQAVKNDLNSVFLRKILAHALVERCDRDNAVEALHSWQQLDPKGISKIVTEFQALAKSFPNNIDIRKHIIVLELQLDRLDEVLESIKILEDMSSVQPEMLVNIYTDFLKKDSQNTDIRIRRARILASKDQFDPAINDLETVQLVKPSLNEVHELLEQLYAEKLKKEPANLGFLFKMGVLLYIRGDIERAIEYFQKTVKEGYREQESAKYLGLCFKKRGMLDLAYRQLSKLPMDVDMKEILYELANDYTEMHQFSKALSVLEQIYAEDINFKDLKTTIARLREQTSGTGQVDHQMGTAFRGLNSAETVIDSAQIVPGEGKKLRYEILKELGRGNMGIVCLAQDKELDEVVALKFLPEELHYDAMIVERFKQEVRSTRRLSHPNIVRIHDMGDEGGRKFISMEYIDGRNLKDILFEQKKVTPMEVIDIGIQIAAALDYAHKTKVVHRDIKPANIMMTKEGTIKVMDFGIASMLERAGLTQTGALIGTPLYMSPEQAEGKPVDGRSDIYSFGVMLYELSTGKPPFFSGNISYQHVHVPPPPIEDETIPSNLVEIILKCMEKSPQDRFQTAGECMKTLEKCRDQIS